MPKMKTANALIKNFLKKQSRTAYADVYKKMLQPNGKPKPELFLADSLHMNPNGYKIWQRQLGPVLKQAVNRNRNRFPEDFMFEMTREELESLRSQSVILKPEVLQLILLNQLKAYAA